MHEKFIFRGLAKKILKERALLTINPASVVNYVDVPFYEQRKKIKKKLGKKIGNFVNNQILFFRAGFCPRGNWDLERTPVETRLVYRHMLDLWQHRNQYQESLWYEFAKDKIKERGRFKHKQHIIISQKELDCLFRDYLLDILISMDDKGYLAYLNTENSRVMITRNGELVKTRRGRHRFAAARIVGVSRMTVEIDNIHPFWVKKVGGGFYGKKLEKLIEAIGELEEKAQNLPITN